VKKFNPANKTFIDKPTEHANLTELREKLHEAKVYFEETTEGIFIKDDDEQTVIGLLNK